MAGLKTTTCPRCSKEFTPWRVDQVCCSAYCGKLLRTAKKRFAEREAKAPGRTCAICKTSIAGLKMSAIWCRDCSKKGRDMTRRRTVDPTERACQQCGSTFLGKGTLSYCSDDCRRLYYLALKRHASARKREAVGRRTCEDCPADITVTRMDVRFCKDCARRRNVERLRRYRRAVTQEDPSPRPATPRKAAPKAATTKPATPKPSTPAKPRPMTKANLDGGPWFPGWNGCYPPERTPEDIERIERGRQLLIQDDVRRQVAASGHVYRYSNFGGRDNYPEEKAS